ncbi:N-acetyl-gamma-glutamyl-phosphate reductase [bacterium]|nr:N-acetyl-gamma-glutamyl-phosphate reductase [bacterium]
MVKYQDLSKGKKGKFKVGIVGASGYTGSELIRILFTHPDVSIKVVTSEHHAGERFSKIHPQFSGLVDIRLSTAKELVEADLDLVFLALPHGISMNFVRDHGYKRFRIIDLSGDFRLKSAQTYEEWYKLSHVAKNDLKKAVFGLPEIFRTQIRNADLVANPGCYATSAILALAPLLKNKLIKSKEIIIDSKSGMTGAGATAKPSTHFPEVTDNFSVYGLLNHRHTPEIQTQLSLFSKQKIEVLFTPHLIPIDRGILSTVYASPKVEVCSEQLIEIFTKFYATEHFIRIVSDPPAVKNVRGSNYCDLFVTYDKRTKRIIVISVIDNLVKGAAGQAVQNMNIMFNLIENKGLRQLPLCP